MSKHDSSVQEKCDEMVGDGKCQKLVLKFMLYSDKHILIHQWTLRRNTTIKMFTYSLVSQSILKFIWDWTLDKAISVQI